MSPSQFHIKKEINCHETYPSRPLKINQDSHFIKKSPMSSCASSSALSASASISALTTTTKPPPRPPVIIYTHTPKVILTNPNDFMALVQKLTGLSKADGNPNFSPKKEPKDEAHGVEDLNKGIPKAAHSDESESSVVTEDSGPSMVLDDVHINSCFLPTPVFHPNISPCFNNIPMFTPNNKLCSNHLPFSNNYVDPLLFMPNMRSYTSSSTNMETIAECCEF